MFGPILVFNYIYIYIWIQIVLPNTESRTFDFSIGFNSLFPTKNTDYQICVFLVVHFLTRDRDRSSGRGRDRDRDRDRSSDRDDDHGDDRGDDRGRSRSHLPLLRSGRRARESFCE